MPKSVITQELKNQVKNLYISGTNGRKIAKLLKIGKPKVYGILEEFDILKPSSKDKFTEEIKKEIAERYKKGDKAIDLAKEYNCHYVMVLKFARQNGVYIYPPGGRIKTLPPEQIEDIVNRWKNGESQKSIAKSYHLTQNIISRFLIKNGIDKNDKAHPRGTRNGNWKGGKRITDDGYILIKIPCEHKFYCMANLSGYIAEHRLVMAEKLGRPLLKSETVHHIDGVKSNNLPENLQLRQGQHGNGVCYKCNQCGSHDISPCELEASL